MLPITFCVIFRIHTFIFIVAFRKKNLFPFIHVQSFTLVKHSTLGSEFTVVYVGRCTSWQAECRGRYKRCCIEYIFGTSLPVTVVTAHRFSSISERRTKRSDIPLFISSSESMKLSWGKARRKSKESDEEWRKRGGKRISGGGSATMKVKLLRHEVPDGEHRNSLGTAGC